jgi:hypothetical protein
VAALAAWGLGVGLALWWALTWTPAEQLNLGARPFQGTYRDRPLLVTLLPAAALGASAAALLPVAARRLRWRSALLLSWAVAAGWAAALALSDGTTRAVHGIARSREYVAAVPAVGSDPLGWLRDFTTTVTERPEEVPLHVEGHPPLLVLVLWAWDRVGLGGGTWAAVLVVAVGTSAVVAVALTLRVVADESVARDALPFLALAPAAVTIATSGDAFYLGVCAWATALLVLGAVRSSGAAMLAGGLLLGSVPYLSYGLLPFGIVPVAAVLLARARHGGSLPWVWLAAGLLAVPALMTAGGFWWPDGVSATHERWAAGLGDDRPYVFSALVNVALLAVVVGPAVAAGATRVRHRAVSLLAGATGVALLVLDLSGVTRLETERIWLPYAAWLLPLAASLRRPRPWLLLSVLVALVLQATVRGVW